MPDAAAYDDGGGPYLRLTGGHVPRPVATVEWPTAFVLTYADDGPTMVGRMPWQYQSADNAFVEISADLTDVSDPALVVAWLKGLLERRP